MIYPSLQEMIRKIGSDVTDVMTAHLPVAEGIERSLFEAMRYSALGGGKRIRPFLVWASSQLFHAPTKIAYEVGAALEFVHSYSLIHDDLPCMDNSNLRRGNPTCHRQFDEETALLAGDALYGLAFEVLASLEEIEASRRCLLIQKLAKGSGGRGMVAGQMRDLLGEDRPYTLEELKILHNLKTGELIQFACESGAILGNASVAQAEALKTYGEKIGLLYQVTDDLLDACSDAKTIGKDTHQDSHKNTFVTVQGIEASRQYAIDLAKEAKEPLAIFNMPQIKVLEGLVDYIRERLF
jgi:farnesyl diphosphate synthase